jgi:hypothetical protein
MSVAPAMMKKSATIYAIKSGFARMSIPKRTQRIPFARSDEPKKLRRGVGD